MPTSCMPPSTVYTTAPAAAGMKAGSIIPLSQMAARITPWPAYYHRDVLPEEEMQIVWDNLDALNRAFYSQNPDIPEIPREILDKLSRRCTASSPLSELDIEIDRLKEFKAAGLTDIAIRAYKNPEQTIELLGNRVIPELQKYS